MTGIAPRSPGGLRRFFSRPRARAAFQLHTGVGRFLRRERSRHREARPGGDAGAARGLHCSLTSAPHALGTRGSEEMAE